MKRIWSRKLSTRSPWEPQFSGVFFSQSSGVAVFSCSSLADLENRY